MPLSWGPHGCSVLSLRHWRAGMSSTPVRALYCGLFFALSILCGPPSLAALDQPDAKAAASSNTGSLVIHPEFESAGPFSEGLAAVQVGADKDWRWGYIDRSGSLAIAPRFDDAEAFCEGLATVRVGDEKT